MAQLQRETIVYGQLGDAITIQDQSQMAYTVMTQPLEGLHNNSQLLNGIYSDSPAQEDHTQSSPSYKYVTNKVQQPPKIVNTLKYSLKIPKTNLPPILQGLPFLTLSTLSLALKQPPLLTLALRSLWFQDVTTLFQQYTICKFILQTVSEHYPKPPPAHIANKQLVEVKISDK